MITHKNEIEIRLIAMRRSGSHAFLNWICSLFDGHTCFINDVTRHIPTSANVMSDDLPSLSKSRMTTLGSIKQLLIYNLEDVFLARQGNWWVSENLSGKSLRKVSILLLRDPFNLFASRIKSGETLPHERFATSLFPKSSNSSARLRRLWIDHAREYKRETCRIEGELLAVSYNDWLCDAGYRSHLATTLGGRNNDLTLRQVPKYGFGSSFEGPGKKELANRVGLLHRWRHYTGNIEYLKFFDEPILLNLSHEIFGKVCDFVYEPKSEFSQQDR